MNLTVLASFLVMFAVKVSAVAVEATQHDQLHGIDADTALEHVIKLLKEKDRVIEIMENKLETFEAKLKEITAQSAAEESNKKNIEILTKTVKTQADRIHELENTIEGIVDSQTGLRSPNKRQMLERPVAFFASLTNSLTHLGVGQNIVFDHVITNDGGAYNPHFGSFVAPVSGVYVFSVSLLSNYGHSSHFDYVKNGTRVSRMFVAGGGTSQSYDTSSQTIVLHMAKGEDLAVHNIDVDEHLFGGHFSTFAGFLLYESTGPNVNVIG